MSDFSGQASRPDDTQVTKRRRLGQMHKPSDCATATMTGLSSFHPSPDELLSEGLGGDAEGLGQFLQRQTDGLVALGRSSDMLLYQVRPLNPCQIRVRSVRQRPPVTCLNTQKPPSSRGFVSWALQGSNL